jgi:hypothetical protein
MRSARGNKELAGAGRCREKGSRPSGQLVTGNAATSVCTSVEGVGGGGGGVPMTGCDEGRPPCLCYSGVIQSRWPT